MGRMQDAISKRAYVLAAELARAQLRQIPAFVRAEVSDHRGFVIQSIPALQVGGTMLALAGDRESLLEMQRVVDSLPELEPWADAPAEHIEDMRLLQAVTDVVARSPGCVQTSMKALIGEVDGRRVGRLIGWLEKAGRITRTKKGSSYTLWLVGSDDAPRPAVKRVAPPQKRVGSPARVIEIDITKLPYIPLPRSPLRWEEKQARQLQEEAPGTSEFFEVRDGTGWSLESVEKIRMADRADTAYRRLHAVDEGLILLDDLGKATAFPDAPASALRYDRQGSLVAAAPLLHDVYRIGVNALGSGLIAMSRDCVLHAYDAELTPLLEAQLATMPEVTALIGRLGIAEASLRNHLRTVSLAQDNSRYMVTGVDESWCISSGGAGLWSARLPLQEGWQKVAVRGEGSGTRAEIGEALALMSLELPLEADTVKRRYRELAKQWHPDLNPGDAQSNIRMRSLTAAFELLTGLDVEAAVPDVRPIFVKEMHRDTREYNGVTVSMSFGMEGGEVHAADWIYAAAFAGDSHNAFLAGYSGRIIRMDAAGTAIRAYDIGSVPRRIVDTGDYLYFLTDTRLYIIRDDALHAIIDTLDAGDLVFGQSGFGLIEKKRFRWYREDGEYQGSVLTKDPIRRVYSTPAGLHVETRQHRAVIRGAPAWW